mmetsp:Transcript_5378/g.7204  ORF Transcript_5378/g.7204 Transcript_5378/m.7204 type:complete len:80 (-) Transcript_5378:570-809(-)
MLIYALRTAFNGSVKSKSLQYMEAADSKINRDLAEPMLPYLEVTWHAISIGRLLLVVISCWLPQIIECYYPYHVVTRLV